MATLQDGLAFAGSAADSQRGMVSRQRSIEGEFLQGNPS